uniref:General transcription factor IIH subunit 3 n=1 Tax=Timema monikensis TaxID=170555 RepID=A0A7R9E9L1_9NEOP|nr:unnamed protein product [Timema monikensis]
MDLHMSIVSCLSLGEAHLEVDVEPRSLRSVGNKSSRDVYVVWSLIVEQPNRDRIVNGNGTCQRFLETGIRPAGIGSNSRKHKPHNIFVMFMLSHSKPSLYSTAADPDGTFTRHHRPLFGKNHITGFPDRRHRFKTAQSYCSENPTIQALVNPPPTRDALNPLLAPDTQLLEAGEAAAPRMSLTLKAKKTNCLLVLGFQPPAPASVKIIYQECVPERVNYASPRGRERERILKLIHQAKFIRKVVLLLRNPHVEYLFPLPGDSDAETVATLRQQDGQYEMFSHVEKTLRQNLQRLVLREVEDIRSGSVALAGDSLLAGALSMALCYIHR